MSPFLKWIWIFLMCRDCMNKIDSGLGYASVSYIYECCDVCDVSKVCIRWWMCSFYPLCRYFILCYFWLWWMQTWWHWTCRGWLNGVSGISRARDFFLLSIYKFFYARHNFDWRFSYYNHGSHTIAAIIYIIKFH